MVVDRGTIMVVDGREVFAVEMAFILFPLSHSSTTTDAESASIFSTFLFSAPAAGRRVGRNMPMAVQIPAKTIQ